MIQLDLFPLSREEELEIELKKLKESFEKVRKKLFSQHSELTKMYIDLYNEFEYLKRSVCNERRFENEVSDKLFLHAYEEGKT